VGKKFSKFCIGAKGFCSLGSRNTTPHQRRKGWSEVEKRRYFDVSAVNLFDVYTSGQNLARIQQNNVRAKAIYFSDFEKVFGHWD